MYGHSTQQDIDVPERIGVHESCGLRSYRKQLNPEVHESQIVQQSAEREWKVSADRLG